MLPGFKAIHTSSSSISRAAPLQLEVWVAATTAEESSDGWEEEEQERKHVSKLFSFFFLTTELGSTNVEVKLVVAARESNVASFHASYIMNASNAFTNYVIAKVVIDLQC